MASDYKKIGSKFERKYGKNLEGLSRDLAVSKPAIVAWEKAGYDIYERSKDLHIFKGNKYLRAAWENINSRCGRKSDKSYHRYGGRGIENKLSKQDLTFLWKRDRGHLLEHPSIDRIDNDGHYSLANCRLIEHRENSRGPNRFQKTPKAKKVSAPTKVQISKLMSYLGSITSPKKARASKRNGLFPCRPGKKRGRPKKT